MKFVVCVFIAATFVGGCCFSVGLIGKLVAFVELQLAAGVPWYELLISCGVPAFVASLALSVAAWLIYEYNYH